MAKQVGRLTSGAFYTLLLQDGLVVRADVSRMQMDKNEDQLNTRIILWAMVHDTNSNTYGNVYCAKVTYEWAEPDGIEPSSYFPLHVEMGACNNSDEWARQIEEEVGVWERNWPEWVRLAQPVAASRDGRYKMSKCHPYLMGHYGRMQMALVDLIRDGHPHPHTLYQRIFYTRLAAFIRAQAGLWRQVGLEF